MSVNEREQLNFYGDRDKWFDFVAEVKKERKKVWQVLEPLIDAYLEHRVDDRL